MVTIYRPWRQSEGPPYSPNSQSGRKSDERAAEVDKKRGDEVGRMLPRCDFGKSKGQKPGAIYRSCLLPSSGAFNAAGNGGAGGSTRRGLGRAIEQFSRII